MKTVRKTKAEQDVPKLKTAKGSRRAAKPASSNGKHPPVAYEHSPVGIVEASLDGKYLNANQEFCRMLGFEKEELLRRGIKDFTHEDDYSIDIKLHEQLVAGKIPFYRLEKRYVCRDGESLWVELTRSLVRDAEGNPLYTVGVVLDISDRKHVERVLRYSVERLRLATEAAQMFMWEWDFERQIISLADSFEQVLGFSGGLLPQNTVEAVLALSPPEDVQSIRATVTEAIENKRDVHSLQYRVINPENGEIVWLEANGKIVYDEQGNAAHMFGVAQNVTQSRKAQDEIAIISRFPAEDPNPVMRLTPEGTILYANPASTSLLEAWAHDGHQIPEELQNAVTRAFSSGMKTEVEIELQGKFFSCTLAPVREAIYVNLYGKDITERKLAEDRQRESEERFRALVSQATAGISETDLDGALIFVNPRFCEMLGYTGQELLGKTIWELTYSEDVEENKRLFHRMRTEGESYQFEKRFVRKDGSTLWTNVTVSTIRDLDGNPKGGVGVVIDIEERKRAEQALTEYAREQAALYRLVDQLHRTVSLEDIYDAALEAILSAIQCDRASILLFEDDDVMHFVAWRGLSTGYRVATDGHSPWKADTQNPEPIAINDVSTADLSDTLRSAILEEGIRSLAFIPLVSNGRLVGKFMIYYNAPHRFSEEELELSLTIARQLAFGVARKRAEEALRESEERLRAILRQATAGIVRKDAAGRLIFVNQAFCNMLGYTEAELLGKIMWELMHEDDIEENRRFYDHMMMEGVPFKLERRLLRQDGSVIWVDSSVSPIMDASGRPQSAVTVEVDITGRRQAEEALQQLNVQLEDRVMSRTAKLRAVNQVLREEIAERKRVEAALRRSEAVAQENEAKLRSLFELLPVGISFLDLEGRVVQLNPALLNILKLSKEEFVNKRYDSRKYIRADGSPMPPTEFASARAIAEKRTIFNVETGVVLESGEVVWTSVSAAPVDVADVSVVVVTVDITDSKRAEQALQESHARLRILSQRLVEVQEEERRALARELHDRVGQTLAALNINLIIINSQLTSEVAEQIGTRLNDSMKLVAETIALVRDVMTDLRPAVLDDYGLEAALESHLAQFISRYDIKATFDKPDQPFPRLGPSVEMTFLRIAQEALMNIARHAQASKVRLSLRQEQEAICMVIEDNGIGIQSWQEANRPGSHGLTIMRERAEAFNGSLQIRSAPGQGTVIEISIPRQGHKPSRQESSS